MSFIGAPNGHLVRMTISASEVTPPNTGLRSVDASSLISGIKKISEVNVLETTIQVGAPVDTTPIFNGPEIKFRAIDVLFQYMKKGYPNASDDDAEACHLIAMKLESGFATEEQTPEVIVRESHIIRSLEYNVAFPNAHQMLLASIHALGGANDKGFRDHGESHIYACALHCPALYSSKSAAAIADAAYLAAWLTHDPDEKYGDKDRVLAETTSTLDEIVPIMIQMVASAPTSGSQDANRIMAFAALNPPTRGFQIRKEDMKALYCATTPGPLTNNRIHNFYKFGSVIGEGTFGKVYKGIFRSTGAACAIKEPIVNISDTCGVDGSLLIEVATLKAIPTYAHIVTLLDAYLQNNGHMYIVYELATGFDPGNDDKTLKPLIDATPGENIIADVMFQITCGVAFLHSYGRVHRDLKPANILVNRVNDIKFSVKVADFGQVVPDPMFPRPMMHDTTLWYRAPESLFDHQLCDEAIDVWALGCILVELVNSKPVFEGDNGMDMIIAITSVLGKPNAPWAGFSDGTGALSGSLHPAFAPKEMKDVLTRSMSDDCVELIRNILAYPESRITSYAMLEHPFFTSRGHSAANEPFMLNNKEMHAMQLSAKRRKGGDGGVANST